MIGATDSIALEGLACEIANLWQRQRQHRNVSGLDPLFLLKMDKLVELLLRGDALRCCCLSKGEDGRHDLRCPAYKPSCKKGCPCRGADSKGEALRSPRPPGKKDRSDGERFVVRGNTYPHREAIKAAGGGWEAILNAWVFIDPKPSVVKRLTALGLSMESL